jgi:hypothetical protein
VKKSLLIKISIGIACVAAFGLLFMRSLDDARTSPYTVERQDLAGWSVVHEPAAAPSDPVVSLRSTPVLAAGLFRQIFSRAMESLNTPAAPAIPLVLKGEFDRRLADAMTPEALMTAARNAGLETAELVPRCLVHRRVSEQFEPWLRGPIARISPLLQPPAHAFVMAREDVDATVPGLLPDQLWARPGGAASIGFHLVHMAGSTDRLLTYARGEPLSEAQRAAVAAERDIANVRPALETMLDGWRLTVERALQQIADTPEASLLEPREVGRQKLPSTVLGLIFHSAEHAQRHVGQIIATAQVVRAGLS